MTMEARFINDDLGVVERSRLLGETGNVMFVSVRTPVGATRGAALVCPPLFADLVTNYRRDVTLARELARHGIAACHFHYHGTGNSEGDEMALSREGMLADAAQALDHLRACVSGGPIGFVGTRWGAFIAAALAGSMPGAPLAMWAPVLEPQHFFREGRRANRALAITGSVANDDTTMPIADELRSRPYVDLVGYPLTPSLYDSTAGTDLISELGGGARPVLLIQFGRSTKLKREHAGLVDALRQRGCDVSYSTDAPPEVWWFEQQDSGDARAAAVYTAGWMRSKLEAR